MTTIHVTIPDDAEALGVISTFLNQGYQVSIDLDLVGGVDEPDYASAVAAVTAEMSRIEADTREKLWGEKAMKRAEADPRHRPFVDERRARQGLGQDESGYYIDGLKVSAQEWDREMRMRQQARDERRVEAAKAISVVGCSACGASVHDQCRSASGKGYGDSFVHSDRVRAYCTVNEVVEARE